MNNTNSMNVLFYWISFALATFNFFVNFFVTPLFITRAWAFFLVNLRLVAQIHLVWKNAQIALVTKITILPRLDIDRNIPTVENWHFNDKLTILMMDMIKNESIAIVNVRTIVDDRRVDQKPFNSLWKWPFLDEIDDFKHDF